MENQEAKGLWSYVCEDVENLIKEYLVPKSDWYDLYSIVKSEEPYLVYELLSGIEYQNGDYTVTEARWWLAIQQGYVGLIKWMYVRLDDNKKIEFDKNYSGQARSWLDLAANYGYLELVKWLHTVYQDTCSMDTMDWAARGGHLAIVQWLHEHRIGCTSNAMDWAAAYGHLETVQWLHENRKEGFTSGGVHWAKMNGHLNIVDYLLNV